MTKSYSYDYDAESEELSNDQVYQVLKDHDIQAMILRNDKDGHSVVIFTPGAPLQTVSNNSHQLFTWLGY